MGTWSMFASLIALCEVAGGAWLAYSFSGEVADKLVCVANNILMVAEVNATAVDSLLGGNVEGITALQESIDALPPDTVDFVLNHLSTVGVALAAPGFIAFLFLLIAICCSMRKEPCCTNTMLVLHGLFCIFAFGISLIAAVGGSLTHQNAFFIDQRDTFEASCDEVKSEMRQTIGNLTAAIRHGEAHDQDVSSLEEARATAIHVQSIIHDLCTCFLEFVDSFGLLSSAGIFGSIVYLIAFVVGCAGCCCLLKKKADNKKEDVKLSSSLVNP